MRKRSPKRILTRPARAVRRALKKLGRTARRARTRLKSWRPAPLVRRDQEIRTLRREIDKLRSGKRRLTAARDQQKQRTEKLRLELASYQGLAVPDHAAIPNANGGKPPVQPHVAPGVAPIQWKNAPVNLYLNFANNAHQIADQLAADVYIVHGVPALPAADAVARAAGGRCIADVIEIPSFSHRALPVSWHPTNLGLLDNAFEGYLRSCSGMLTVGWKLRARLEYLGPPIAVIPNYRPATTPRASDRLRHWCGLHDGDRLVLSLSSIASGMEAVIHALAQLPQNVHLAQIGPIVPDSYAQEIGALIDRLGLRHRVHLFDPVAYDDLTSVAAGADVGLIVRDPEILNNYVSLPNRVFDYLASGLPFCAPRMPDIAHVLEHHDTGTVVETCDAEGWAAAIQASLRRRETQRANCLALAAAWTWESLEDQLVAFLGRPDSVTFFGINDLARNNRTQRIARTLAARGTRVAICTRRDAPAPDDPDISYYVMP